MKSQVLSCQILLLENIDYRRDIYENKVAAERAFRMYMNAMKQNPEQIMKERRYD